MFVYDNISNLKSNIDAELFILENQINSTDQREDEVYKGFINLPINDEVNLTNALILNDFNEAFASTSQMLEELREQKEKLETIKNFVSEVDDSQDLNDNNFQSELQNLLTDYYSFRNDVQTKYITEDKNLNELKQKVNKFIPIEKEQPEEISQAIEEIQKEDVLLEKKDYFISCALKKGYQKDFILKLYEQILKFADYGFNKSHSVSYAHLAYIQAYLKTYYAPYFIVELLNFSLGSKNNIYLAYLKQKGFKLIKPSINNNSLDYEIKNNYLIMPLNTIKNINNDLAEKILNNKKEGYHDYFDFVLKNKNILNINILTTLIYAGALDCFKLNQTTLLNNMEKVLNYASLDDDTLLKPSIIISKEEKIINKELELYGFYITNHPASKYIDQKYIKLNNINNYLFKNIIVVCLIENIKEIVTKKKEKMAFMKASDETGNVDLTVFPKVYNNINIKENNLVKINGQVVKRFDKISIIVNNISKLED